MKKVIAKARLLLCAVIVCSFILPAYHGYSALRFIPLSLSESGGKTGLTSMDVLVLNVPLLLIPVTAIGLCLLFGMRIAVRRIYLLLPLLFLVFFLTLLFRSPGIAATGGGFKGLQLGFYLTALSAIALPFTQDAKKKSRKRIKRTVTKVESPA